MDENEIKSLKKHLPNIKSIKFHNFPLDDNQIQLMLSKPSVKDLNPFENL